MADPLAAQRSATTRWFWYNLILFIGIILVASAALYIVAKEVPLHKYILNPSTTVVEGIPSIEGVPTAVVVA